MHKRIESRLFSLAFSLGGLFVATSCGVGALPGEPAAVSPSRCHGTLAQAIIGPMGGRVEVTQGPLRGARVDVPPGAVAQSVTLTLRIGRDLAIPWTDAVPNTNALCIETDAPAQPTGQTFAADHLPMLVLPYDQAKLEGASLQQLGLLQAGMSGEVSQRVGGLMLVDPASHRAGHTIEQPGIYQIIKVGAPIKAATPNLNLLFVIDNSGSMSPKQKKFVDLLPTFFDQVTRVREKGPAATCINYRLGVVTTDMGQSTMDRGDDGTLQTRFCHTRAMSASAAAACRALGCDKLPMAGLDPMKPFIDVPDPADRKNAAIIAQKRLQFQCLAFVGDVGSGVEQPLESMRQMYRKQGTAFFQRKGGLQSIFIVTDEGDCSMNDMTRASFFQPSNVCMKSTDPGCYPSDHNLRCLGTAFTCKQDIHTVAGQHVRTKMTDCKLTDPMVDGTPLELPLAYATNLISFITKDLKEEQSRLFVRGLWPQAPGVTPLNITNPINFFLGWGTRQPANQAADAFCVDPMDSTMLGHPQLRLNQFMATLGASGVRMGRDVGRVELGNICDPTDRGEAAGGAGGILADLADSITKEPTVCTDVDLSLP